MNHRHLALFIAQNLLPSLILLAITLSAWQVLVEHRNRQAVGYVIPLPAPTGIAFAFWNDPRAFAGSLWVTAEAALIGFACSAVFGTLFAIILASSTWFRRAAYPFTLFFQTVPVIAIAPLLELWSGAGMRAVVIVTFVVSVFPVIANTLTGLLSTEPALEDLFKLYGAKPFALFFKLRLPWSLPYLLTGLRIAAGLSVIGTIVAEFFVGSFGQDEGLGVRVVVSAKYGHTDAVFVCVVLASLLGLAIFALVGAAGQFLLRR